ncbi:U7 snRNA-associated Sm-like protein LSm11 [Melitaea cinxia]|uniref:U7 snRNA-associated Sm-like protein LSm11 n=1 Tax=Melitaea cinxia TaxID=113334 RepID=UPI001E2714F7|nr:U7 snRNA-associated Sm-like protein LSm11 [Melitaea cinxia]
MSSESSSESEIGPCSSKFDPHKVLYAEKPKVPVENAPLYENLQQFETALKYESLNQSSIIPVGKHELVQKREEEKKRKKEEEERLLEEKNKQRFAKYEGLVPTTRGMKKVKNIMTRMETMRGPLGALKDCVDQRLRIKVITRNANGIRGVLHATLVAFDKQWNLAMTDVLEVWKKKAPSKRKIPPNLGKPVPRGTAAAISPVPVVTETPLGGGVWECTRFVPQMMVRGEHVVLVNIVER